MTVRRAAFALSLALLWLATLRAATPIMPISEVRPGMIGIGHTVFAGTKVEEFKAHVLGVIENVIGARRNLIIARLEGGPLAETGVIAGMSGSPVYVDGRLIGAVCYRHGADAPVLYVVRQSQPACRCARLGVVVVPKLD